jgi:hypothetical protein
VCLSLHEKPEGTFKTTSWQWFYLAHPTFGGVTTGRFWCGTNVKDFHSPPEVMSSCRLKHYLKPLEKGLTHVPPDNPEAIYKEPRVLEGGLHPGSFLPITSPRQQVIAPSVFSPTKWVIRHLTVQELAGCCDVPDSVAKTLTKGSVRRVSLQDVPFVTTPPAKILGGFVELMKQTLTSPAEVGPPVEQAVVPEEDKEARHITGPPQ